MIEQTLELILLLDQRKDRDEEDTLLLMSAKRFMQGFYKQQEALLKKATRELDEELDRATESSTS
jgi:hypothetical protein